MWPRSCCMRCRGGATGVISLSTTRRNCMQVSSTSGRVPSPKTTTASGPMTLRSEYITERRTARTDPIDRKSTRLNSSHEWISYAVFCLKKKKKNNIDYNGIINNTLITNRTQLDILKIRFVTSNDLRG